jgi:hypothetical protein
MAKGIGGERGELYALEREEGVARDKGRCSSIVLELSGILGRQQQQPILWYDKVLTVLRSVYSSSLGYQKTCSIQKKFRLLIETLMGGKI